MENQKNRTNDALSLRRLCFIFVLPEKMGRSESFAHFAGETPPEAAIDREPAGEKDCLAKQWNDNLIPHRFRNKRTHSGFGSLVSRFMQLKLMLLSTCSLRRESTPNPGTTTQHIRIKPGKKTFNFQ